MTWPVSKLSLVEKMGSESGSVALEPFSQTDCPASIKSGDRNSEGQILTMRLRGRGTQLEEVGGSE